MAGGNQSKVCDKCANPGKCKIYRFIYGKTMHYEQTSRGYTEEYTIAGEDYALICNKCVNIEIHSDIKNFLRGAFITLVSLGALILIGKHLPGDGAVGLGAFVALALIKGGGELSELVFKNINLIRGSDLAIQCKSDKLKQLGFDLFLTPSAYATKLRFSRPSK